MLIERKALRKKRNQAKHSPFTKEYVLKNQLAFSWEELCKRLTLGQHDSPAFGTGSSLSLMHSNNPPMRAREFCLR